MDVTAADTAPDGAAALEQAMPQSETAAAATTAESVSGGEAPPKKKKKKKLTARGGRLEGMTQTQQGAAARAAQSKPV